MSQVNKSLYDNIFDRWSEMSIKYAKVNANRDIMTQFFRSDEIIDTNDAGELMGVNIYNGSGPWFSRLMATGFQGATVSKNIPWIRYQMEQFNLRGIDALDIWNQDIKDHMATVYQKSNFYDTQPQFTHDGVTLGSPVIFGEEDLIKQRTMWMPQHYKTVRLYYDKWNIEEGVITEDKTWTAKQIFDKYIKTDDVNYSKSSKLLPISVVSALQQNRFDEVFTMFRATFKYNDPIWDVTGDGAFVKPKGDWDWLTAYFLELSTADLNKKNIPLNENMGDFSQPFAVWNFDKKPWEPSSRTPAWYALWDNLSLQQVDKNIGEDSAYKARPAMVIMGSQKNIVQFSPEGRMIVDEAGYDRPPKPIDRVGDLVYEQDFLQMKTDALSRWFMADFWTKFTDLVRTNKQPVSAAQVWQMVGEKASILGPAIETHGRYLDTIDARMMDIEARAGRGPFGPERMEEITAIVRGALDEQIASVDVKPVFIGALYQAQKASQQLEPIMSGLRSVIDSGLLDMDEDLVHGIRKKDTMDDILEAHDFPAKNIVPKEEYAEIKAGLDAQRAAAAQAEQAIEMAKASGNLTKPVDETSLLAGAAG